VSGPIVVFGGGALGSAVARLAASRGEAITVASRNPGEHPGWWRRHEVGGDQPLGWLPAHARVVVAVSPGGGDAPEWTWGERLAGWLRRLVGMRPEAILLAGPAGSGTPGLAAFEGTARSARSAGVGVLRLPALLAMDRHWAGTIAAELRMGRRARVSVALPETRALAADDAARAALHLLDHPGDELLTGAALLRPGDVLAALAARYGIEPVSSVFARRPDRATLARLTAQRELPDRWDDVRFGPRLSLSTWAERLPGPRRRRGTPSAE
jgi:nucleoside-diphosphate-sugar epimerase